MRRMGMLLALAIALAAQPAHAAPRSVVLISLDGTTPAQIADPSLPTLARLLREGTSAERLVPVFPSNTFPNHVTFVTGVAPDRHGIVNNVFLDPRRGRHSYGNDPIWIEVEPIWSWASAHGVVSAAFHWVGSEGPWTSGRGPRYFVPFDPDTPETRKVDQILAWLDLADPAERPRLVTSWFHGADGAGHSQGPDSAAARRALRSQDAALGRLVAGLEARRLLADTALLLVSDHGMAKVERIVNLSAELRRAGVRARVLGGGGVATVYGEDAARAVEVARGLGLEAYLRAEAPAAWRVGHPRFGDAVVLAPVGTALVQPGPRGLVQRLLASVRLEMQGSHGHAPDAPEMAALFVAFGAGIQARRLGSVRAVDVAPTVLALLGIPRPEWMEGTALLPASADVPSALPREVGRQP